MRSGIVVSGLCVSLRNGTLAGPVARCEQRQRLLWKGQRLLNVVNILESPEEKDLTWRCHDARAKSSPNTIVALRIEAEGGHLFTEAEMQARFRGAVGSTFRMRLNSGPRSLKSVA